MTIMMKRAKGKTSKTDSQVERNTFGLSHGRVKARNPM